MTFFAALPAIIWALMVWFFPEWLTSVSLSVPGTVSAALGLVFLVAAFFRQWQWFYWCAWVGGIYATIQLGLQQPLAQKEVSQLYEALPVWLSVSALLLTFLKKPVLLTGKGILIFVALAILPLSLLLTPVAQTLALLSPAEVLTLPDWQQSSFAIGLLIWTVAMGGVWATYLLYKSAFAFAWSHWAAWFSLMVFLLAVQYQQASTWAALAASACLLLALADQMLKLAYIDELTGLPQRRALMSQLQHLRKRSAVCMLDVDHFKKFNDRYGHEVGDQVLRLLGSILKEHGGFKAYRYGGEEFTLVFFHNDEEKLKSTLESVRSQVANYPLKLREPSRPESKIKGKEARGKKEQSKTVKVTISLGATLKEPDDTADSILKRADENLYSAKKAGRNRIYFCCQK
ncbi:diguanylate cyclase (GGDEF)-like protein [Idiomarina loihiensis]|uniref:GGDEF domain-containing protein n=1 Tax=Idiomarina TaxID=135575 RepID=UPI000D70B736|nr:MULTISPECIES: GGDEF domain-containing protein [Idiomarina]PWW38369.1 diguanylate cyclase (GGDEF)-like protein [Idiomarina loihiensis]TDP48557.1 diguanylate cyclase (GGDEF)-like protein [Idiomarina loihiensis]TDS23723.1 diguanylate cyclase (GGDEF)-like protein [Idiomarina sp. H2]